MTIGGPVLVPTEVRVTRTDSASNVTVLTETLENPKARVRSATARITQTMENQEIQLSLWNDDGLVSAWLTGDALKLEARALGTAAWVTLVDGFIGPINYQSSRGRSSANLTARGWTALLDIINLPTDLSYESVALTTIIDNVITAVLGAGFARSITTDAATASLKFPAGMKLREALDIARRALNTGSDKWEHVIETVGGVKTYRLFKRSATVQRTIKVRDLLEGSKLDKGDVAEVVNKARVTGATLPTFVSDRSTATRAGYLRPTATAQRFAQPFTAKDTPFSALTLYADRSRAAAAPTLTAKIARNTKLLDVVRRHPSVFPGDVSVVKRSHASYLDGGAFIVDLDPTAATDTSDASIPASTTVELVAYDFGASPPTFWGFDLKRSVGLSPPNTVVDYSDDDSSWTNVYDAAPGNAYQAAIFASAQTHRYWRVRGKNTDAVNARNVSIAQMNFFGSKNTGADATNPVNLQDLDDGLDTTVASTGAATKVVAQFDLTATAPAIIRLELRHQESASSALLNLLFQKSTDAATWVDMSYSSSTTGVVEDSIFVQEAAFRYLRVIVKDERPAASGSITTSVWSVRAYVHDVTDYARPFAADAMIGGDVSWDQTGLVTSPGTLESRSYSAPRLSMVANGLYWLLLSIGAAATAMSFWDLGYSVGISLTSLSLYLGFEENTGTTSYDGSGNGLNGTMQAAGGTYNEVAPFIVGKRGYGLRLHDASSGSSPFVQFADTAGTNPSAALTIAMWVRPKAIGAKQGLAGKGNGNPTGYALFIDTDGKLQFRMATGGTRKEAKSTTALTASTWVHVGCTYDGANVKFYLNGVLDSTVAMTGTIDVAATNFWVGRGLDTGAVNYYYFGDVDEFYLYLRVLTGAEILFLNNLTGTDRVYESPDSGTTWFSHPADQQLLTRFDFNTHTLEGTAEDAASQATYANLVPGGVLYGAVADPALLTQDAVDKEALSLINRRKTPPRRIRLLVPIDTALLPGQRVTLELEAAEALGLSAASSVDVLNVEHVLGRKGVSVLDCDEYPIAQPQASDATAAFSTQRRI